VRSEPPRLRSCEIIKNREKPSAHALDYLRWIFRAFRVSAIFSQLLTGYGSGLGPPGKTAVTAGVQKWPGTPPQAAAVPGGSVSQPLPEPVAFGQPCRLKAAFRPRLSTTAWLYPEKLISAA
jgi:hypothetical protein